MGCCLVMAMLVAELLVLRDRARALRDGSAWRAAVRRMAWPATAVAATCALGVLAIERDAPMLRALWDGAGLRTALSLCRAGAWPSWLAAL